MRRIMLWALLLALLAPSARAAAGGRSWIWGENIGWIDIAPGVDDVRNEDGRLKGMAWSENAGWILFDPAGGGVLAGDGGELSGYAWGENIGWISFSCADANLCGSFYYGVSANPATGVLEGAAWSENAGWILCWPYVPDEYAAALGNRPSAGPLPLAPLFMILDAPR